jgi:uncharacterized protein YdeI (YjbR/CyaY-like superfamily)
MPSLDILGGVVHALPDDLKAALLVEEKALDTWQDISDIVRNEWICWVSSAKKHATRLKRIAWGVSNLKDGKRRPCCWEGSKHR